MKQYEAPQIRVNLDSEYFKWKEKKENQGKTQKSDVKSNGSRRVYTDEDELYDEDDSADWEPKKKGRFFWGKNKN